MTRDEFWAVIETARREGSEAHGVAERVSSALAQRSAADIRAFEEHRLRVMQESYGWGLWGAAYLINGGCSDDGFEYFRSWLITQGRTLFETATQSPDSLAAHVREGEEPECEDFMYVADEAHEAVAGGDIEGLSVPYAELGEDWDFDSAAEMSRRYPKLWKKFGW